MSEQKVRNLVRILNEYPDVETSSSCGGHKDPSDCQLPENEWSVTFDIWGKNKDSNRPSLNGWKSLGKISHAIFEYLSEGDGEINLICCNLSDRKTDPEGLCNYFEVHGYGADVGLFCKVLKAGVSER
jgi:hypothetical protein